jgi:hypothetical protein
MKKTLVSMIAALALGAGAANAENAKSDAAAAPKTEAASPFNPSTWFAGGRAAQVAEVNFANPDFWMAFIQPEKHDGMHAAMFNPVTWSQFANPSTYVKMFDPQVWAKWMDQKTYAPITDPKTYAYWMQPGSHVHNFDPAMYSAAMNPDAYAKAVQLAMADLGAAAATPAGMTMFNPFSWFNVASEKKPAEAK